ncbi:MAG: hypothetical protein R3D85_03120 [Paracoccaceae bacterium]
MTRSFPSSHMSPSAGPGGVVSGRRFLALGLGFAALGGFAALLPWLPAPRGAAGVDLTLVLWAALGAALARAMRGVPEARPALAGFAGLAAAALAAGAVPGGGVEALALVAGLGFLTGGVFAILFGGAPARRRAAGVERGAGAGLRAGGVLGLARDVGPHARMAAGRQPDGDGGGAGCAGGAPGSDPAVLREFRMDLPARVGAPLRAGFGPRSPSLLRPGVGAVFPTRPARPKPAVCGTVRRVWDVAGADRVFGER